MKEVNPKETTRAYAFEFWMRAPMPMVTFFQDNRCLTTDKNQQKDRTEIQYVDVLLHRQGGKRSEGILHAAGRRKAD